MIQIETQCRRKIEMTPGVQSRPRPAKPTSWTKPCCRPYRSAGRPTSRRYRQPRARPRMNCSHPRPATTSCKTEAPAATRQRKPSRMPPARASRPTPTKCSTADGQAGRYPAPAAPSPAARRAAAEGEVSRDETAGPQRRPRRTRGKRLRKSRLARSWRAHLRAGWRVFAAWATRTGRPAADRPTRRPQRGRQHRPRR
jgi:hypothetical protein